MVAPIMNEKGNVEYYLPKGTWTNILTNKTYVGPIWVKENHDYTTLPLLARENTILVTSKQLKSADHTYLEDVSICLYEIQEGQILSQVVHDENQQGTILVTSDANSIEVKIQGFAGNNDIIYKGKTYHIDEEIIIER